MGLGHRFLRHIERTRLLIHLIDVSPLSLRDPVDDYRKINEELRLYSASLSRNPQVVAASNRSARIGRGVRAPQASPVPSGSGFPNIGCHRRRSDRAPVRSERPPEASRRYSGSGEESAWRSYRPVATRYPSGKTGVCRRRRRSGAKWPW